MVSSKTAKDGLMIVIGGGKGGVGKTTVSLSTIDWLIHSGIDPHAILVVESDVTNPDVAKAVGDRVPLKAFDLHDESGFILAGNAIESGNYKAVVINSAAGTSNELANFEELIREPALKRGLEPVLLFPINRQRDSLEILNRWLKIDASKTWRTAVIMNEFFGAASLFTRYAASELPKKVSASVAFPPLNDLIADRLIAERLCPWNAAEKLTIAERSALERFRRAAHAAIGQAVLGATSSAE